MPKYTNAEIQRMAVKTMQAKKAEPDKYLQLILMVSVLSGLSPEICEQRIEDYSHGKFN